MLHARALHTPPGPHLNLITMLERKVSLPVLLTPHAILLRIAHNGVDIPVTVEARVEMQHEGAAVLPYIHSKPGETERQCKGGICSGGAQASPSPTSIYSPSPYSPFGVRQDLPFDLDALTRLDVQLSNNQSLQGQTRGVSLS